MNSSDSNLDSTQGDNIFEGNNLPQSNSIDKEIFNQDYENKTSHQSLTLDNIKILNGEPYLYKCNTCLSEFKTEASIKYHEFCHNGEKPYRCEKCGQGFQLKSHYDCHMRAQTGECPYACFECGNEFAERENLIQHLQTHTGKIPLLCEQSGGGFSNFQAQRPQLLSNTGKRPFECKYCKKCFAGGTLLKRHVATHKALRTYTCSYCGESFESKNIFDLHLQTHLAERPFGCSKCTRAFSNKKDLLRHTAVHSGERPFKCRICETCFRRKDNLDRHIQNTHSQSKEVAKRLTDRAVADYVAKRQFQPSGSKHSFADDAVKSCTKLFQDKMGVVITAELSPPQSPMEADEDRDNIQDGDVSEKKKSASDSADFNGERGDSFDTKPQYFQPIS